MTEKFPLFGALAAERLSKPGVEQLRKHRDVAHVQSDDIVSVLPLNVEGSIGLATSIALPWDTCRAETKVYKFGRTKIPWGVRSVDAPDVWPFTKGEGATVAIVDTGIDDRHPDLVDRVVAGFSALGGDYRDENGHGTHVAGTVAATGVPGGILGVAPRADLLAVKVMDARGIGRLSYMLRGLSWIAQRPKRVPVVNMSLGGPLPSPLLQRAVERLREAGTLVVAASGNLGPRENSVAYPARFRQAIAVGAYTQEQHVAGFSSRGEGVDFIAPGQDVESTWPGGSYRTLDGTSMASPHVAGIAALLWTVQRNIHKVEEMLFAGASALMNVPSSLQGRGMIRASGAFRDVLGKDSRLKKGTLTGRP